MRYHLAARYNHSSIILLWILQRNSTLGSYSGNKEFQSSQEIVLDESCFDPRFIQIHFSKNLRTYPRTQHLPETEVSRKCFEKLSPYGHGMMCSFMAIFSSLFAISAHSEAGGACMSNQNSFRASLLCSLVCSVSSSFGAYLRKWFNEYQARSTPNVHCVCSSQRSINVNSVYVLFSLIYPVSLNQFKAENLLLLLVNLRSWGRILTWLLLSG